MKGTAVTIISHKCRQVFRPVVAKAGPCIVCVQMERAVSNGPSAAMVYGLNQHCPHRNSEHFLQSEPTDGGFKRVWMHENAGGSEADQAFMRLRRTPGRPGHALEPRSPCSLLPCRDPSPPCPRRRLRPACNSPPCRAYRVRLDSQDSRGSPEV